MINVFPIETQDWYRLLLTNQKMEEWLLQRWKEQARVGRARSEEESMQARQAGYPDLAPAPWFAT
jgi:hypothetical protein